jgi:hypothetical protein
MKTKELTLRAKDKYELDRMINSNDITIVNSIFNSIKNGIKRKSKKVCPFKVRLDVDPELFYKFEIQRDEWTNSLTKCLGIYEKNEMYENCGEITILLESMNK